MNIFATSRFTSPFPLCGLGIWPRKRAVFCACIMTNSMNRCANSPEFVLVCTSAMLLGFRFCWLFWRSDNCQHVGLLPNILRRYTLDVVECYRIHFGCMFPVVTKAQ